jgi:hypothetical protein
MSPRLAIASPKCLNQKSLHHTMTPGFFQERAAAFGHFWLAAAAYAENLRLVGVGAGRLLNQAGLYLRIRA